MGWLPRVYRKAVAPVTEPRCPSGRAAARRPRPPARVLISPPKAEAIRALEARLAAANAPRSAAARRRIGELEQQVGAPAWGGGAGGEGERAGRRAAVSIAERPTCSCGAALGQLILSQ